jgi:cell division protein FtsW
MSRSLGKAQKNKGVDRPFLFGTLIILVAGFFIFCSASLGLLAEPNTIFKSVVVNQIVLGLGLGLVALLITMNINYRWYRKYALWIYIISFISVVLVFVPHIGFAHGGARRWIGFGSFTLQPTEIYKIGFVIYFAAWLSGIKNKVQTFKYGLIPFLIFIGLSAALILAEPDTATFAVVFFAGIAMYVIAGCRWRDIAVLVGIGLLSVALLAVARPYVLSRIKVFMDPTHDPHGAGYQIEQSLIAIGSGGLTGRGFGQSVQKFNFLPEPIGDSIFAVAGEEFGFLGTVTLVCLYIFITFRGLKIARRVEDPFGKYLVIGFIVLISAESMINIASMVGILPVSGIPLIFISHGGTAMLFNLAAAGIILNVSKVQKIEA